MENVASGLSYESILVNHGDLDCLVGQIMQYIEATYSDKEQREAHKRICKTTIREWLNHLYEWQKGWEIAVHVNPKSRQVSDEWSARYKVGDNQSGSPIEA
jgi:hypothetical protein